MEIKKIDINQLKPNTWNPNKIDNGKLRCLRDKITKDGYLQPILVRKKENYYEIIDGYHRWLCCKEAGYTEIECVIVDVNDRNAKLLTLAMNNLRGSPEEDLLKKVIEDLENDMDLTEICLETGFSKKELEKLLEEDIEIKEDNFIPEEKNIYNVKRGDIWQLGDHRLMCGDATNSQDVEKLMNGEKINLVVTSPPYYNEREYSQWSEYNDYLKDIEKAINNITLFVGNPFLICWNVGDDVTNHLDIPAHHSEILKKCGFIYKDKIAWVKVGAVYSQRHRHIKKTHKYFPAFKWEPILIFRKEEHPSFESIDENYLTRYDTNVWEITQVMGVEQQKIGHPAVFPLELPSRCIRAYSMKNAIVLDPFGGSGSTLIACEQLNRICYIMEIDTVYCSVIIKRWEDFTGKKAYKL